MSRHGKIQLSRSKAVVLVAAGALSVVTAASATAATWPAGPHGRPAGPAASRPASATATAAQGAQAIRLAQVQDAITLAKVTRAQAAGSTAKQRRKHPASPRQIARVMLHSFRWSAGQFSCLDPLWAHESGWSVTAYNPYSGAYGIPQALPGAKMASAGPAWRTSATTQIRWGLRYIRGTYGSPCGAWAHEEATGWY